MGFNYGYEKKKFDSRWKRLEVEYCDAGMSEEQIAAMKEYDWAWFCSQRVFQNWCGIKKVDSLFSRIS